MRSIIKAAIGGLILSLTLSGVMVATTGCAGNRYQRSTGDYIDDKALSARVKTTMFRDAEVSGFDVGVNVYRGEVQLTGFVDTQEQRERAGEIARSVEGVRQVVNNLEIKPGPDAVGAPAGPVRETSPATIDRHGETQRYTPESDRFDR
jgi:hyperosmotically inducible periplasmic protein